MRTFIFLSVVLAVALADEKYTTKYDNLNLDQILPNERLRMGYVDCLMERGPCPPDGAELKRNLPDALTNGCAKCSEKQKEGIEKVIHYLIENDKKNWNDLQKKYDPEGIYTKKYKSEAEKHHIKLD